MLAFFFFTTNNHFNVISRPWHNIQFVNLQLLTYPFPCFSKLVYFTLPTIHKMFVVLWYLGLKLIKLYLINNIFLSKKSRNLNSLIISVFFTQYLQLGIILPQLINKMIMRFNTFKLTSSYIHNITYTNLPIKLRLIQLEI